MEYWKKLTKDSVFIKPLDRILLKKCKKYYSAISISMSTIEIPRTQSFSLGVDDSIFGEPIGEGEIDGWPAIWKICEAMEIGNGAGNQHQKQLEKDCELTKATYKRIDGEWYYRLHPDTLEKVVKKYGV